MNDIVALWTHPRSMSTAFERYFIERNDHYVYHEPFSYHYFFSKKHENIDCNIDAKHPKDYEGIKKMIYDMSKNQPVFHKDMCYHCIDELLVDEDFLKKQKHTFLIRDPYKSIPSHYKIRPEFSLKSAGHESVYDLLEKVKKLELQYFVIDADDLANNPEDTINEYCAFLNIDFNPDKLTWAPGMNPKWKSWDYWHNEVSNSSGFSNPPSNYDLSKMDAKVKAYVRHHLFYYDQMKKEKNNLVKNA